MNPCVLLRGVTCNAALIHQQQPRNDHRRISLSSPSPSPSPGGLSGVMVWRRRPDRPHRHAAGHPTRPVAGARSTRRPPPRSPRRDARRPTHHRACLEKERKKHHHHADIWRYSGPHRLSLAFLCFLPTAHSAIHRVLAHPELSVRACRRMAGAPWRETAQPAPPWMRTRLPRCLRPGRRQASRSQGRVTGAAAVRLSVCAPPACSFFV